MASETGRGESGVDSRFLYDGPFEPPLYRIKRAPPDKILALRASRAAVLVRAASRKLDVAMKRAARLAKKPGQPAGAESEDDGDPGMRVNSHRVAEILASHRREFDAMDPDEQDRFMETIRLFAAERIKLSEWFKITQAVKLRYQAALPVPEPTGGRVKAKDRPSNPPQGW
jgi:hypothetical protein